MKFVLILMVKNEARIIKRCLQSVEGLVDAYCITDTGSTDTTCDIVQTFLKTHKGCLHTTTWRNFGDNRTESFQVTRDYLTQEGYDLATTYGLLLDGDMVFQAGTLRDHPLGSIGYSVVQIAGHLEYPNCRLIRMDYPWKCLGVTHEYWDGHTDQLPKSVCWVDDRNDGGCKHDKFERDARLLEQGLVDQPKNERYMFYLAQTYHSLGRYKDSIRLYKQRIHAGGWFEEIWYAHYMIGQCYDALKDPIRMEAWMLRAHALRPSRAEPIYKLAKYFREKGDHYKAYHYVQLGRTIPKSKDSLFVEAPVYEGLFDYESTILRYYLGQPGLEECMRYMLTKKENLDNVYRNMPFYIEPLQGNLVNHPVLRDVHGPNYHPTSVCFVQHKGKVYHNVRFVNYAIDTSNGSYSMKQGGYSPDHLVRTQNALWTPEQTIPMKDETVTLPRRSARILGLEDIRIYENTKGGLSFVASSSEYSEKIRIVQGDYHLDGTYGQCRVLEPPTDTACEKNWLPIPKTNDIVYNWHPLTIGTVQKDRLVIQTAYETPWFFKHLRGSAIPFQMGDHWWCLVHFVEHTSPRKYYHCFVELDATYKPIAISLPFVFRSKTIEYCLGCLPDAKTITFGFSTWDDNPCVLQVPITAFQWVQT